MTKNFYQTETLPDPYTTRRSGLVEKKPVWNCEEEGGCRPREDGAMLKFPNLDAYHCVCGFCGRKSYAYRTRSGRTGRIAEMFKNDLWAFSNNENLPDKKG
jgi:hypothetical protein